MLGRANPLSGPKLLNLRVLKKGDGEGGYAGESTRACASAGVDDYRPLPEWPGAV